MKFNYRQGNLEVRSTDKHLFGDTPHTTAEIVSWNDNTCFTVAYWVKGKEGFDLQFVGDRPFNIKIPKDFMSIAQIGQTLLEKSGIIS